MKSTSIEQLRREGLLPVATAKVLPEGKPNRKVSKSDRVKLEDKFLAAWRVVGKGLPMPLQQYKFHETRRWKFDFAWDIVTGGGVAFLSAQVAVEIQGGSWVNGGHNRAPQQAKDYEKLNAAQAAGWIVLQYNTIAMKDPYKVAAEVAEILCNRITKTA